MQSLRKNLDAITTPMLIVDTEIGLGIDVHVIHIISLAARFRVATRSGTLADGLAEIQAERNSMLVTVQALAALWEENLLHRSMADATIKNHDFVCWLDRSGRVLRAPPHRMQASATTLLCEHDLLLDFSGTIATRTISRHRISQILLAIRCASRATCPGLALGSIRVMCNWSLHLKSVSHRNVLINLAVCGITIRTTLGGDYLQVLEACGRSGAFSRNPARLVNTVNLPRRILVLGVVDAFVNALNHH